MVVFIYMLFRLYLLNDSPVSGACSPNLRNAFGSDPAHVDRNSSSRQGRSNDSALASTSRSSHRNTRGGQDTMSPAPPASFEAYRSTSAFSQGVGAVTHHGPTTPNVLFNNSSYTPPSSSQPSDTRGLSIAQMMNPIAEGAPGPWNFGSSDNTPMQYPNATRMTAHSAAGAPPAMPVRELPDSGATNQLYGALPTRNRDSAFENDSVRLPRPTGVADPAASGSDRLASFTERFSEFRVAAVPSSSASSGAVVRAAPPAASSNGSPAPGQLPPGTGRNSIVSRGSLPSGRDSDMPAGYSGTFYSPLRGPMQILREPVRMIDVRASDISPRHTRSRRESASLGGSRVRDPPQVSKQTCDSYA